MTAEELKKDLESKGWTVELVKPPPDNRFRRMGRRHPSYDYEGIVAKRGGQQIAVRAPTLATAARLLMERLDGLSRAA